MKPIKDKTEVKKYALRMPSGTLEKIKYIAAHHGRSAHKEIEQLIRAHIQEFEEMHGAVKKPTARK